MKVAPPVQYVRTTDGYDIAFTVTGQGRPFVLLPTWTNHVREIWSGASGFFWQDLSERFRLVNYDARGMGMSTRGLSEDLTLDSYFRDLDAVLDRLDIQRFVLLGSHGSALLAGHYAVLHPERVEALILNNSGICWLGTDVPSLWDELPRQSWDAFLYSMMPKSVDGEVVEQTVQKLKRWVAQQDYLASTEVWRHAGLEAVLECLQTPTLVLKPQHCPCSSTAAAMELASRLPDGRLVLMDSDRPFGHPGQAVQAIDDFLREVSANRMVWEHGVAGAFPSSADPSSLTDREIEVLRLVASGRSNLQIAEALVISPNTVAKHVSSILTKTDAGNRTEATSYAHRHYLV